MSEHATVIRRGVWGGRGANGFLPFCLFFPFFFWGGLVSSVTYGDIVNPYPVAVPRKGGGVDFVKFLKEKLAQR